MGDISLQNNVPDPLLAGKELPTFKFELEKSKGKVLGNSFGKEVTVEQLPSRKESQSYLGHEVESGITDLSIRRRKIRIYRLLRAINVGRGRTVGMQSLRQIFESLGLSRVATFIASGNVIFEATTTDTKTLERKIEKRLREVLGHEVPTFIRREAELAKIANYQPFRQSKLDPAVSINIVFLADRPDQKLKQRVRELCTNTDSFQVHGREIYWLRRRKQSGSPFLPFPLRRL